MNTFTKIVDTGTPNFKVELSIDLRTQSRIIANTTDGLEIAIKLDRGMVLQDGTLIANDDGQIVEIVSACEKVSKVSAKDLIHLCKLAYHLGNRHVPLEINSQGFLRYQVDHVLDQMVEQLGGKVEHEVAKFAPETGAYAHHHHDHEHDHDHEHEHHHH